MSTGPRIRVRRGSASATSRAITAGRSGRNFGGLGHASHQNGLDADVYYPRRDGAERSPISPGEVDRRRAQALVDRFVAAGAEQVFVGPSLDLRGPSERGDAARPPRRPPARPHATTRLADRLKRPASGEAG